MKNINKKESSLIGRYGNHIRILKNAESLENTLSSMKLDQEKDRFSCLFLSHQLIELSLKALFFYKNDINQKLDIYYKHKFINLKLKNFNTFIDKFIAELINILIKDEDIKNIGDYLYISYRHGVIENHAIFGKNLGKNFDYEVGYEKLKKINLENLREQVCLIYAFVNYLIISLVYYNILI